MKKQALSKMFFARIIIAVGVLLIVLAIAERISYGNFAKSAEKTTAVIESISMEIDKKENRVYTVDISYTVDGKDYTYETIDYNRGMEEGDIVDIIYNRDDPSNVMIESISHGYTIAMIIAGVIVVAGGIFIIKFKPKNRGKEKVEKLQQTGKEIYADYLRVDAVKKYDGDITRYVFVIELEYTDEQTQNKCVYRSEELAKDPEPKIKSDGIKKLRVFVDERNAKKYHVEVDEFK